MNRILSLLAGIGICLSAAAQAPADLYYTVQNGTHVTVYNANNGTNYTLNGYARNIGIDNNHNVYVLVGDGKDLGVNYTVYKNGKVYQKLQSDSEKQFYTSMAMKVVGNDVVVAGVESKEFNKKGYESRQIGYVNCIRIYQTDWDRKSLKRDHFGGYREVKGSGTSARLEPVGGYNALKIDPTSIVYYVTAVDYVDGFIYTTGWGEREYTETPLGYVKQYLVRRCPRVWKNGKEIVKQYENRTGAAYSINVMRNGKNILTSGHLRGHICGWDGNKDMLVDDEPNRRIIKEAVLYNGMVDGAPLFTRMIVDNAGLLYMVNTGKNGNQKPDYLFSNIVDVVVVGKDFYALSERNDKIYRFSCSNWMLGDDYDRNTVKVIEKPQGGEYTLLAVHK